MRAGQEEEMEDFKNKKSLIEHFLISKGHIPVFLPKFHQGLKPIERVWAQLKQHTKADCKVHTPPTTQKHFECVHAYDSVSVENIQNHFRKVRHYMFAFLEGFQQGKELDEDLKKYKIAAKSHQKLYKRDFAIWYRLYSFLVIQLFSR